MAFERAADAPAVAMHGLAGYFESVLYGTPHRRSRCAGCRAVLLKVTVYSSMYGGP